MSIDDEREMQEREKEESGYDWSVYGDHAKEQTSLDGKDILAIFIASIQTIFLPLVILGAFMFVLAMIFGFLI